MTEQLLPQEIIRRKRDGETLSEEAIGQLVQGITDGSLSDAQVGAFAMAVYLNDLSLPESIALTRAMMHSGDTLNWQSAGLHGPVIDKHSTGGVGDKVSLMLAPIVAAAGGFVPMISGRGLGHTGGTLDKLESIPGYDVTPDQATFQRVVRETGCAIIGQTTSLAPADGRLYAIRDTTATVESIGLITASILSKKLAAGLDALVMDVKVGNGAFMTTAQAARELARSIVEVGSGAGTPTTALLTDMNQVLGSTVGNALELDEARAFLCAEAQDPRLRTLVLELAAQMLLLGKLSPTLDSARERAARVLDDGAAAERFARMVAALGGPHDFLQRSAACLPRAACTIALIAQRDGFLAAMDTRQIGLAVLRLGGGRRHHADSVDHSVGLSDVLSLGAPVQRGQTLAHVHAATDSDARSVLTGLGDAFVVADDAPVSTPIVLEPLRSRK